ncbi:hypothetical protein RN001_002517 [Aquatica leii]|uniref:Vacuolar-sorting protein SNF8 n=1 Tax=Aquatica leii TaxID=1421715 RepID=A0AAN7SDC1_9COLE|nr:hypothetical protein RN001_002517 [Aquatica leii]
MYGAEIWGWKEWRKVKGLQEKYWRWVLGLDRDTPGYIVREEVQIEKIRIETGKRAIKYEEEMRERTDCKILQECWKEIKGGKVKYGQEGREEYYKRNGYASEEVERLREEGVGTREEIIRRDRDSEKQERWTKIKESRYNRNYKDIKGEGVPEYLKDSEIKSNKRKKMVARFRCGNEELGNKYWKEEPEKLCRLCGEETEDLDHMRKRCRELREEVMKTVDILDENGKGAEWMEELSSNIIKMRRRAGVGAIQKQKLEQEKYKDKGNEIQENQFEQMTKQLDVFKVNLEEFAVKHKNEIRKNAQFRKQFQDMCASIGVDPLASGKGFWSVLGIGDFYYELAVQIVEVCLSTTYKNGGLISLSELRSRLIKARGQARKLKIFGSGFSVVPVGKGQYMVQSVPVELSMDHTAIIQQVANSNQAFTSVYLLREQLNWESNRAQKALDHLLDEGLVWVDVQDVHEKLYYFPSLFTACINATN